ncbi:MAG: DUF3307 domain-containing protein [Dysgonamonadaceae bacterium]|jgi:hypothetical protein|nr:DUF3307 domain-containing protein [Dysgonamonadaceae bacterium]
MKVLITLQLLAHLLADFNLQPQRWCTVKETKIVSKELFYHTIIVFVCSFVLSFNPCFVLASLIIALSHFGIDILKNCFFKKKWLHRSIFFIDQALHILVILAVVHWFYFAKYEFIIPCIDHSYNVILLALMLIASTKPSNIFIKKYMESSGIMSKDNQPLLKAGRVIGSLERILSFLLITINQFTAVGFIIAAKSILRFRDKDTAKTEYVLIGSLLSFGIAILLGIIYNTLIKNYANYF